MDEFTEGVLARARERQKQLGPLKELNGDKSVSEPILSKSKSSESSTIQKEYVSDSVLGVTSDTNANEKTLNIQKENLNMEIKVTTPDDVRLEVQIEEQSSVVPLREEARNRLNRLGKLYSDDPVISSPIQRTEAKFHVEDEKKVDSKPAISNNKSRGGLSRLANLAETINQWEDEPRKPNKRAPNKSPAPQPPRASIKMKKAPAPPVPTPEKPPKALNLDKDTIDTLEAQGFTRTDSNTRLIYKYDKSVASKVALYESSPSKRAVGKEKDPSQLSLAERKALFERNKGEVLLPKAPFGMSVPPSSPKRHTGITNKVANLFEAKPTIAQQQIENKMKEERQKELDIVLNRFNQPEENSDDNNEEDETDFDEKTVMIQKQKSIPNIVAMSSTTDLTTNGTKSTGGDSSKVAAVLSEVKEIRVSPQKKKKKGRLYPCLSDIENADNEQDDEEGPLPSPQPYTSCSDDGDTSFGRELIEQVDQKYTPQKRVAEDSCDSSDISDDLANFADEITDDPGPTPPKHAKGTEPSISFKYKTFLDDEFKSPMKVVNRTPRRSSIAPTYVIDGESVVPLKHTVSFYRKQQAINIEPSSRKFQQDTIDEPVIDDKTGEVSKKIKRLQEELNRQEMIISQTSRALNLCSSTPEFMGSTEHVEADRVLLLSSHRRQTALHEIQRLEVEDSIRPLKDYSTNLPLEKGVLIVSGIEIPLKEKYIKALLAAGGKGHHVVCLIKCDEQVVATQLISTVAGGTELKMPDVIKIPNVYNDFRGTVEIYCLQAQEEVLPHALKYHINTKKTNTPKRHHLQSPAGPQTVRSPSFALMGYAVFTLPQVLHQKQWQLNNTPPLSPLEGTIQMSVTCEMVASVEHRGFLTMFEDVSGFGAWHRRWCLLKGNTLSYWKYPDDERKRPPIECIDLRQCSTEQVGPVSRAICARMHTFLIERERDALPDDKDTLVVVKKGEKTVQRHLLSADTKEDRMEWCAKFNAALAVIHMCGGK